MNRPSIRTTSPDALGTAEGTLAPGREPLSGRNSVAGLLAAAWTLEPVEVARRALIPAALMASFAAGAASTMFRWLPLGALIGAAGLTWLSLAPAAAAITVLLVLRGLTDSVAHVPLLAGLNAGGLLGLTVVLVGAARLVMSPRPRGVIGGGLIATAIGFWLFIAYTTFGAEESLIRELVRSMSLLAVALIAINHAGSLTPRRLATIAVWTSMVPAATVLLESAANWQDLAGDFRARGAVAHPNSAGLLFAIAMVFAAWRWACDGGGRRYLAALAVLGIAVILTKSMGSLGQVVITLLAFSLLNGGRANRWIIALLVGGFLVFIVADPLDVTRFDELRTTNIRATEWRDTTNTLDWRIMNAVHFLDEWREAPLIGQGFGTTVELIWPIGYEPHSDPLRFLVETGVIGTLLIAGAFAAWMNYLVMQWRRSADGSFFAAMLALFIGLAAHSVVTHATFETAPMFLLAVVIGATLSFRTAPASLDVLGANEHDAPLPGPEEQSSSWLPPIDDGASGGAATRTRFSES